MGRMLVTIAVCLLAACGATLAASAPSATAQPSKTASATASALAACVTYPPLPANVGAEIQHIKTAVAVVEVLSTCTVRVRVADMRAANGPAAALGGQTIVLHATSATTYTSAAQGDQSAIGRFGLKAGDVFTLSFDSRQFPDGSHPLNFMNW